MTEPHHGIPYPGPLPLPTPEHQRKITKNKWFEIAVVIGLILAGTGFLAWQNYRAQNRVDAAHAMADAAKIVVAGGAHADGSTTLLNRRFDSFAQSIEGFDCHVDLVGEKDDAPVETIIAWLTPTSGTATASPEALQKAVNHVGHLGQELVATSTLAFEKAAKTMSYVSDTQRPHDKGVAATNDGWKLTYVNYRSYDEKASPPQAVLYFILQRLGAGSNPALATLNRTLYDAVQQGIDIKAALRSVHHLE